MSMDYGNSAGQETAAGSTPAATAPDSGNSIQRTPILTTGAYRAELAGAVEDCQTCRGVGEVCGGDRCMDCGGAGRVYVVAALRRLAESQVECGACGGTGCRAAGGTIEDPCQPCNGTGREVERRADGCTAPAGTPCPPAHMGAGSRCAGCQHQSPAAALADAERIRREQRQALAREVTEARRVKRPPIGRARRPNSTRRRAARKAGGR